MIKSYLSYKCISLVMLMLFFSACENDMEKVKLISTKDTLPNTSAKNVELFYSEFANVRIHLTAPLINEYELENPYREMPKGIKVLFFDSVGNQISSLRAEYAISYQNEQRMEAKNDVVVINEKNEQLNTEHLIWDQKKKKIFSEKFVKITTPDKIIHGDGFESDETFDKWSLKKIRGTIEVEVDEDSTSNTN